MLPHNRLRKVSRKWQSSIILIKIKMTLKELRKSSKNLLLRMKHYLIHRKEKYTMFMEKKVFKITKVDVEVVATWMIFFLISSVEAVDLEVEDTFKMKEGKNMKISLLIQT